MCVWMCFNDFICASREKAIFSHASLHLLLHVTVVILWHFKLYSLKIQLAHSTCHSLLVVFEPDEVFSSEIVSQKLWVARK